MKALTIRLDTEIYNLLNSIAKKREESMAAVARKILSGNLQSETALDAQDILITTVRKAIRTELKTTENRLANLCVKNAITSSTTEELIIKIMEANKYPDLESIKSKSRRKGVAYVKQPLELLLQNYDCEGE